MPEPAGIDISQAGDIAAGVLDMIRTGSGPTLSEAWVSACSGSGACIDACNDGINPRFMIRLARVARSARKEADAVLADGKARFQKMARGVRVLSRVAVIAAGTGTSDPGAEGDRNPKHPKSCFTPAAMC